MSGYTGAGTTFVGGAITSPILGANGSGTAPTYSFSSATGAGMSLGASFLGFSPVNNYRMDLHDTGGLTVAAPLPLGWEAGNPVSGASQDTSLKRLAAGVIGMSAGSGAAATWLQQSQARIGLAADYTNATAGLTATNLSVTLLAGRKYNFILELFLSNSTAAEGATIDFNGGGASVTNFRVQGELYNQAPTLLLVSAATALATTHTIASLVVTTQCHWRFSGTFEVNAGGTFIIRAAENSHSTGTLTINRGSFLWIEDMVYA